MNEQKMSRIIDRLLSLTDDRSVELVKFAVRVIG